MASFRTGIFRSFLPRRICYRLALSYTLLLALFIFVIGRSIVQVAEISERSQEFAQIDLQRLLQVQDLALDIEGSTSALVLIFSTSQDNRKPAYEAVDQKKKLIDLSIARLQAAPGDEAQALCLQRLSQLHQSFRDAYLEFFDQIELENLDQAKRVFENQVVPARRDFLVESAILKKLAERHIAERQMEEQRDLQKLKIEVIAVSIFAALLGAGLAFVTQRSVVDPLNRLEKNALSIASGDYSSKLASTSIAEIDRVGKALNSMGTAIAERETEIEFLAYYDALTGLPNRTSLVKRWEHFSQDGTLLILMDVARLKVINETLGFGEGDAVLVEASLRLKRILEEHSLELPFLAKCASGQFALCCRYSGDDRGGELADSFIQAINRAFHLPVLSGQYSIDVGFVFGLALANQHTPNISRLIRNAEVALYAAKQQTLGFVWYSDAYEASRLSHLTLLSDLRAATHNNELQMWLQPKLTLIDARCYGFEALVRWQHPQRGFISPAEFVPFAERTGYISHVTDWMLNKAVQTLASWRSAYPDLSIAVNVSTNDLRDHDFAKRVAELLQRYQVPAGNLQLELTESGIMESPEHSIVLLKSLREIGIGISIDDFGTGHSSLSYLQKLPVSELKIDRSFVIDIDQHPPAQNLVNTIIEMGHSLNLHVIAEGIETQQERDTLTRLKCDSMQGYFASKPLFGEGIERWLAALPKRNDQA